MSEAQDQERLADYLGDEMTGDERRRFEAALSRNPRLEQEVASLQRTLDVLRALDGSLAVPIAVSASATQRRSIIRVGLRSAALVAIAFGAGYLARSAERTAAVPAEPSAAGGGAPHVSPSAQRFAEAWSANAGESDVVRALLAAAHATRER
jgi:anti-sigma factor RsiW